MRSDREKAERMDGWIGSILGIGVGLSAAFLLAGMIWRWAATGHPEFHYALEGTNLFQFWVSDIRQITAGAFRPRLLVNVGIALLMMTPYLRVLVSLLYFFIVERNWKYTLFTGFVLAVLTYSLFLR